MKSMVPIKKYLSRPVVFVIIAILAVVLIIVYSWHRQKPAAKEPASSLDLYQVDDENYGMSFSMSKNFTPIPEEALKVLNPAFVYGYEWGDDPLTKCIISPSKLASSGDISATELRDGLFKEIRKVNPDAKLVNSDMANKLVQFGNARGVLLDVAYTDGAYKIRRVELIALGKKTQVIAFCQSLAADNAKHKDDFTIFFSSLKITG